MPANSLPRRILKKALSLFCSESDYRRFQAAVKARDIRSGDWTEPELDIIRYAVGEGETALDIGANMGLFSYHLSRAVGANGKVYAFEPLPYTYQTFELVIRRLSLTNVELITKGCGERAERMTFTVPVNANGSVVTGLTHMGARDDAREGQSEHVGFEKSQTVECDVIAIDDFLVDLHDVSMIKCDIEGAEIFALRGAAKTIEQHHPTVICEINPWFLDGFGLKVHDIVDFFDVRGYSVYRYEGGKLHPAPVDRIDKDNFIFIHPDRMSRVQSLLASTPALSV